VFEYNVFKIPSQSGWPTGEEL
jgi:hypothetical protein